MAKCGIVPLRCSSQDHPGIFSTRTHLMSGLDLVCESRVHCRKSPPPADYEVGNGQSAGITTNVCFFLEDNWGPLVLSKCCWFKNLPSPNQRLEPQHVHCNTRHCLDTDDRSHPTPNLLKTSMSKGELCASKGDPNPPEPMEQRQQRLALKIPTLPQVNIGLCLWGLLRPTNRSRHTRWQGRCPHTHQPYSHRHHTHTPSCALICPQPTPNTIQTLLN